MDKFNTLNFTLTNIYLDIDGVLLSKDLKPANYSSDFIKHVVSNFPTFWLTTHCRQKENHVAELLSRYFSEEIMEYIRKIKPTEWNVYKTEAIDFSTPFLWFDNTLLDSEKKELIKHNRLENWIEVNLIRDENILGIYLKDFPLPMFSSDTL